MSAYVDREQNQFGRMVMCHMFADAPDELHAMADKIGVARRWFQNHPRLPHYDICRSKRALAVAAGAIEVGRHEVVAHMRRKNENRSVRGLRYGP